MVGGQNGVRLRDLTLEKDGGKGMKNGFVIFLVAFGVLLTSWTAFVLKPQLQLGRLQQVAVLNSSDVYPVNRPGEAAQGLQVYRANGCAACHTEQVQQSGTTCDIFLTSTGKNPTALTEAIVSLGHLKTEFNFNNLPKTIFHHFPLLLAEMMSDKITAAGGKAEIHIVPIGADISRGWGLRHSVAEDFLYDDGVQLGNLRVGPDLAGVGARLPDVNWQLLHLYAPQSLAKDSVMPPFRYLFETKKKVNGEFSPDALNLPPAFAPAAAYEVVPTDDAKKLVAYLLSLHADVPLYDAPFTPPQPATNSAANKK
jgi:cbb3-type cytochrome oxidase cytochrome c subunit